MIKRGFLVLLFLFIAGSISFAATKFEYYPMDVRVYSLLKSPTPDSEAAFVFPIEITLTGISTDRKWYRFKVFYDLVFFGKYQFEGWCNVDTVKPFISNITPEVINLK